MPCRSVDWGIIVPRGPPPPVAPYKSFMVIGGMKKGGKRVHIAVNTICSAIVLLELLLRFCKAIIDSVFPRNPFLCETLDILIDVVEKVVVRLEDGMKSSRITLPDDMGYGIEGDSELDKIFHMTPLLPCEDQLFHVVMYEEASKWSA